MDPLTAALNLATEIVKATELFWSSMSEAQRTRAIDWHQDNMEVLQKLFAKAAKD